MANVVLGVTGGIAAYKSAPLIRQFSEAGHSVQVVVTKNALRFIGQTTLEALSGKSVEVVDPDLFTDVDQVKHISLAKNADLILIAPATASFIAKLAAGIADDLLTTTVLAATAPVVIAPAMHTEMWENQATTANLATLVSRGLHIVEPGIGRLTGEDSGQGRLAEPEIIFARAESLLHDQVLRGKRVLVSAGGTREPIDAARYVGNYSSGKQGLAFAKAAKAFGAEVHLVAANLSEEQMLGLANEHVQTAKELERAILSQAANYDLIIMAAAVADYSPSEPLATKIKRAEHGPSLELVLVANNDILQELTGTLEKAGSKTVTVGFAAEASSNLEELGKQKLSSKGCDFVVANDISQGKVFGSDETKVVLVSNESVLSFEGSKDSVARSVLLEVSTKLGGL